MKRICFIALMAIMAVACAKNEVVSIADQPQEIRYQNVINPIVKTSNGSFVSFGTDQAFKVSAVYLPKDMTWLEAINTTSYYPTLYMDNVLVTYVDDVWKCADKYYIWPTDGASLVFFAIADGTKDPLSAYLHSIGIDNGQIIYNYDLEEPDCKNKELMLSITDRTYNYSDYKNGDETTVGGETVTLQFEYIVSKLKFTVRTAVDAAVSLKSIKLNNISTTGTYHQPVLIEDSSFHYGNGACDDNTGWYGNGNTKDLTIYTSALSSGTPVDETKKELELEYYIMKPQPFESNAQIEVNYTITTNYASSPVVEEVTMYTNLKDLYPDGWKPGYQYGVDLVFYSNQIEWNATVNGYDPA